MIVLKSQSMGDCIFCKIAKGEIPSDKVYEGEHVIGIFDKFPQAPRHYLLIPKKHITEITDIDPEDSPIISEMFSAAKKIAEEKNMKGPGFRLVLNQGAQGGQTVFHLHMHLLGGRQMAWPPG